MSVSKKTLIEFLERCPDNVEIGTLSLGEYSATIKHVHLCNFKDGSNEVPMVVFCPMGSHIKDDVFEILDGAADHCSKP